MALTLKLLRDLELPSEKNMALNFLGHNEIELLKNNTPYLKDQIIKKNRKLEKILLDKSFLKIFPHEVGVVRIINSQNENICSKFFHGGQFKSLGIEKLRLLIKELVLKARRQGLTIEEIEIAHTHPSVEVMLEKQGDASFVFNGLSKKDQRVGELLGDHLDFPLKIKAITPAANYSMYF